MIGALLSRKFSALVKRFSAKPWKDKSNVLDDAVAFSIANNIIGDYYEFGVYQGKSFIHAYKLISRKMREYRLFNNNSNDPFLCYDHRYFAFDSFEGLPETDERLIPIHWRGAKAMSCSDTSFKNNLKKAKVDLNKVEIIKGYYDISLDKECLQKHDMKKAAIIHIDCDLYKSTLEVLAFITPLITDGTVIVFDDYFYYKGNPGKGERGAFTEWLTKKPEYSVTELAKYYPAVAFIISVND